MNRQGDGWHFITWNFAGSSPCRIAACRTPCRVPKRGGCASNANQSGIEPDVVVFLGRGRFVTGRIWREFQGHNRQRIAAECLLTTRQPR